MRSLNLRWVNYYADMKFIFSRVRFVCTFSVYVFAVCPQDEWLFLFLDTLYASNIWDV